MSEWSETRANEWVAWAELGKQKLVTAEHQEEEQAEEAASTEIDRNTPCAPYAPASKRERERERKQEQTCPGQSP